MKTFTIWKIKEETGNQMNWYEKYGVPWYGDPLILALGHAKVPNQLRSGP